MTRCFRRRSIRTSCARAAAGLKARWIACEAGGEGSEARGAPAFFRVFRVLCGSACLKAIAEHWRGLANRARVPHTRPGRDALGPGTATRSHRRPPA